MNTSPPRRSTAPKERPVLGSFLSALAGWVTIMVVEVIFTSVTYFHLEPKLKSTAWWYTPGFYFAFGVVAGAFIFGTWLVVLIPLYLFVPSRSALWHWPILTTCGAISAGSIMFAFCRLISPQANWTAETSFAAIAGASTCLFASLTRKRFCRKI